MAKWTLAEMIIIIGEVLRPLCRLCPSLEYDSVLTIGRERISISFPSIFLSCFYILNRREKKCKDQRVSPLSLDRLFTKEFALRLQMKRLGNASAHDKFVTVLFRAMYVFLLRIRTQMQALGCVFFFSAVYAIVVRHSSESKENVFVYHNYKFLCEELGDVHV